MFVCGQKATKPVLRRPMPKSEVGQFWSEAERSGSSSDKLSQGEMLCTNSPL